jgi:hypothetical protein
MNADMVALFIVPVGDDDYCNPSGVHALFRKCLYVQQYRHIVLTLSQSRSLFEDTLISFVKCASRLIHVASKEMAAALTMAA